MKRYERKTPTASEESKPIGKKARKRYGLRIWYTPRFLGREFSWAKWYPTERARQEALTALRDKVILEGNRLYARVEAIE